MTDARGFQADGTHIDTGVARDPRGYDKEGVHISQNGDTRGLRSAQPRSQDGKFSEKTGAAPEVQLAEEPIVGVLGETPSQYARRSQRFDEALRRDLRVGEDDTVEEALRYSALDAPSIHALMHEAVEMERKPENLASFPEVDELYSQAAAAEARLINNDFRRVLDEHRPGTKSIILGTWSGTSDVDIVAFENDNGSLDTEYDSVPGISSLASIYYSRLSRLTSGNALSAVSQEEASQFASRVVGNRRIVGGKWHRVGEQT